ncbi:PTS sugar transporter subunit IIA [Aestuariibacter salexigens]|uniref:PTS sugar transporter subunit IIA n=1 Tax=Aestuariibacter salexigens TaxID=226010 RepID=UPI0006861CFF|nr:PTS glucose transporter subunit IIA [Aestuariibacter salexigens]
MMSFNVVTDTPPATFRQRVDIVSPLSGRLIPLDDMPCPAFQARLLGDGVAFQPAGSLVHSPFDAIVEWLPATAHQIRLRCKNGLRLLIQIGTDSHIMMGVGFRHKVKQGQKVAAGEVLLEFDLPKLKSELPSLHSALTIINCERIKAIVHSRNQVIAMDDIAMTLYL